MVLAAGFGTGYTLSTPWQQVLASPEDVRDGLSSSSRQAPLRAALAWMAADAVAPVGGGGTQGGDGGSGEAGSGGDAGGGGGGAAAAGAMHRDPAFRGGEEVDGWDEVERRREWDEDEEEWEQAREEGQDDDGEGGAAWQRE